MREIGDIAPIRDALVEIESRQKAARSVKDERVDGVLGDVRQILADAIADALRPPGEDGISPEEYAIREGISRWAVYKKIKRGEIQARKTASGHLLLPAA
jgi:hypothetical protein